MYINKLIIQNYRNFTSLEVNLKPFTLLIGENNIGKTNFLNAIGLIFSQDITFFKKRNLELDDINYQAIQEFKKSVINNSIAISDIKPPTVKVVAHMKYFTNDQESVVADWFINENLDEATITYSFQPKEDLTSWIENERIRINKMEKIEEETDEEFTKKVVNSISFPINKYSYTIYGGLNQSKQIDFYFLKMLKYEFLDAVRDVRKQLVASSDYRLLYKILVNRGQNGYKEILEALSILDKKVKDNPVLYKIEEEIAVYLEKTSLVDDEAKNKVEFSFSKLEEDDILKKLSLLYSDSPISIERNGTGRNNLLYISLILSHLINSKSEGVYFRLIGIEEPEAHLHPHLQEHLAKHIESEPSENLQLIMTSHSTHITGKLSLDNTVIFYNDEIVKTHYVLDGFERSDSGKLTVDAKSHIRYLQRYLDATKSTMFFARRVILVEGISEQILIPTLFYLYANISLEKAGCSIVNVNGVAFSHFIEIIKNGYFIKCLVLTDRDSKTQREQRAEDLKSKYDSNQINISITENNTFEEDIIAANTDGDGKSILFGAIAYTRRNKVKDFRDEYTDKPIDIEECFSLIKDYKANFATDLKEILEKVLIKNNFAIPQYILDGFQHIYPISKPEDD